MANTTVYPFGQGGQLPSGIALVNDLKTGGADKALAAEQGKVIGGLIYKREIIDIGSFGYNPGGIASGTGLWTNNSQYKFTQIKVSPGEVYEIEPNGIAPFYAFFSSAGIYSSGGNPPYITGEDNGHWGYSTKNFLVTIPEGCNYLYIALYHQGGSGDLSPNAVYRRREVLQAVADGDEKTETDLNVLEGSWEELFDFSMASVISNDSTKISIDKIDGEIVIENIQSTGSKYALISLPSALIPGVKYNMKIDYSAGFDKLSGSLFVWWLGFADSSYASTTSATGIYAGKRQTAVVDFIYEQSWKYLRLASYSQSDGAKVVIHSISISPDRTTVAKLAERISNLEANGGDMENLIRQARFVAYETTTSPLALLHFSDIHGDTAAAMQIKKFAEKYSSYIDDMVQTGDTVQYYYNSPGQGYEWFQQNGIPEALFVIGNHDGAADSNSKGWKEGSADWDYQGKEWDFDTYFADYISTRGVTPPDGYDDLNSPYYKALYWHKDYDSAKIRVIGLDCMHFNDGVRYTSNDQETWLAARLAETLDSGSDAYGYSVVFLCHYPLDDYSGMNETWDESAHKFVNNQNPGGGCVMDRRTQRPVTIHYGTSFEAEKRFCMRNRVGTVGSTNYTKGNDNPIADVIQLWMNNGGKYLAWLSGHTHNDYMYYPEKYPQMLVIGLPQAGNARGNDSFADRDSDSEEHSCANLIVFDTQSKRIKIVRFGKTMDRDFKDQRMLSFAYEAKNVLGGGV